MQAAGVSHVAYTPTREGGAPDAPSAAQGGEAPARDAAVRLPTLRVYPSVGDNPYQSLLYSAFPGQIDVQRLRRPQLLRRWGFVPPVDVLHFHWEDGTFWEVKSQWKIRHRLKIVLRMLDRHKAAGGKLVWTVHNERPHREGELHEGFLRIRDRLVRDADMVHVHSAAAREMLLSGWPVDPAKIEVIGHPSYVGYYPEDGATVPPIKVEGRARLLFFGSVNAYKGVDTLIDALEDEGTAGLVDHLTIAGSSKRDRKALIRRRLAGAPFPTDLKLYRVPDAEVAPIFRGAHFSVLPYRRTLTSGVAHLAMTFGLPVIGPRLGGMAEALPESCHQLLYDAEDPSGVATAIARAAALSAGDYARLSADCLAVAAERAPQRQSAKLIAAMRARGILG